MKRSVSSGARALLVMVLCTAVLHQFAAAAAGLLVAWLMSLITAHDIRSRTAQLVYVAVGTWFAYWLALSYWIHPAAAQGPLMLYVIYPLVQHPDFVGQIVRPWIGSDPVLFVSLVILLSLGIKQMAAGGAGDARSDYRVVLILFLCLLIAAAAGDAPRHETRYVFFLFPLALLLSIAALRYWLTATSHSRLSRASTLLVLVAALILSCDFRILPLLQIGAPGSAFRFELSPAKQAHMVIREDSPHLADWLRVHAAHDTVISAFQSLDYYYPALAYFYVARSDFNFASYACRAGTVDRWSNRPLLQSTADIAAVTEAHGRVFLVTYSDRVAGMRSALARYHSELVWQRGHLAVLRLEGPFESKGG